METVYLGLGSNLGDRRANLQEALQRIGALPGTHLRAVSSIVESVPQGKWDGAPAGDFLNCCARIDTTLTPGELLRETKRIESELGRAPHSGALYQDRPIDIDILLFGDLCVDTPDLQIPHPRMRERAWVMEPLGEVLSLGKTR